MSAAAPSNHDNAAQDPIEEVTKYAPVVIPVAGGILIFLLAFIAVFMACSRGLGPRFPEFFWPRPEGRDLAGSGPACAEALQKCE